MSKFDPHNYSVLIKQVHEDGEIIFRATVKELPHVAEYGDSYAEVYDLAIDTINGLHKMAHEMGHEFPSPIEDDEVLSGRVTLRMPKSLHRTVAATAESEGISLNTFLVTTIAERVSIRNMCTALVESIEKHFINPRETTYFRRVALVGHGSTTIFGALENIDIPVIKTANSSELGMPEFVISDDKFLPLTSQKHG